MSNETLADLDELVDSDYVPHAVERKKAVMMYLLMWLVLSTQKTHESTYLRFHFKQAIGYWFITILYVLIIMVPLMVMLWRWWFMLLPLILLWVWVVAIGWLFLKQAWDGTYDLSTSWWLTVFYAIGSWLVDMFDIEEKSIDE